MIDVVVFNQTSEIMKLLAESLQHGASIGEFLTVVSLQSPVDCRFKNSERVLTKSLLRITRSQGPPLSNWVPGSGIFCPPCCHGPGF